MALIPVNRATLGGKRLKQTTSFTAFAKAPFVDIVGSEFAPVATCYPIFFMEREGHLVPVALMGLGATDNLFVEADGGWSGGYVPAIMRRYPFSVQTSAEGQAELLYDDASGMLSDDEGEPLFGADEEGDKSAAVARVLQLVSLLETQFPPTLATTAEIAATGIIKPISIMVEQDGEEKPLTGLHAINEAAFNALSDESWLALRRSNAITLIYSHLVSIGQVASLKARNKFRQAMAQARRQAH